MNQTTEPRPKPQCAAFAKTIFEFTQEATPTISNYDSQHANFYGQYPDVKCIIKTGATSGYQLQQMPQFNYINGRIDSIYFDMGGAEDGFLVLS
ncbi:MAG: hypothetical protein WCK18_19560 [Prolixibacteraceae bacterium]